MIRIVTVATIALFISSCNRHVLSESKLKSKEEYRELSEALKNPDDVYSLNMHIPDSFPKEILKLKRLNELDVYMPKFKSLPAHISKLKNLQILMILDGDINKLPPEIVKLKHLKWLRLWKINLKELPASIAKLKKLETLELFANDLRYLPEGIINLKRLKEIGIDSNNDLDFYDAFEKLAQLPQLNHLNINYYPHDTLPSNISKLQNLETISIWNNTNGKLNLDDMLQKLSTLKKLKKIDLSGTPIAANSKSFWLEKLKKQCPGCEITWHLY